MRPISPVSCSCRRKPGWRAASSRSSAPKITSVGRARGVQEHDVGGRRGAPSARSMLMIGVMPLPALMKRSAPGSGSGSTKVPSTPPRRTIAPGRRVADEVGRDLARLDELRRDADAAVRTARVGGQRVGAPVVDAVDHDHADAQVLAGLVALPLPARLDHDRRRVGGLALDALDPAAQLLRGPERVDQLEVVVGQQRREEAPQRVQRPQAPPRDLRPGAALSHAGDSMPCRSTAGPATGR